MNVLTRNWLEIFYQQEVSIAVVCQTKCRFYAKGLNSYAKLQYENLLKARVGSIIYGMIIEKQT